MRPSRAGAGSIRGLPSIFLIRAVVPAARRWTAATRWSAAFLFVVAFAPAGGCITTAITRVPHAGFRALRGDERVVPEVTARAEVDELAGELLVTLEARPPDAARWSSDGATECVSTDSWPATLVLSIAGGVLLVVGIGFFAHAESVEGEVGGEARAGAVLVGSPLLAVGGALDVSALVVGLLDDPDDLECSHVTPAAALPMQVARFDVVVTRPNGTTVAVRAEDGIARVGLETPLYDCTVACPAVGRHRPRLDAARGRGTVETLTIEVTPCGADWAEADGPPTATTSVDVAVAPPLSR